jgi:hypothetical protein
VVDIEIDKKISELSAQNLLHRSASIEQELLKLRLSSGRARCEGARCAESARPIYPDIFSALPGLPEVYPGEFNAASLAAGILYHGAIVVRGLYNSDLISRLESLSRAEEDDNRTDNSPLGCTPHTFFELLEVYQESGLLGVVGEYLGDQPVMFAERIKLRHHRAKRDVYADIPWHQDVNFFGAKSYAVNCWAAVTPCGDGNPGLGIVPTRIEERLGWSDEDGIAPLDYGRSMSDDVLEDTVALHPVQLPKLNPGDAILFDEMTVHQTALQPWTLAEQIVTISWFFRPAGFPDWGSPLAV